MPALSFTLNQLAAALLGAGAYIYQTSQRGGWKACAIVCGCRIERSSPDPYAALGAVAKVLIDYEAQQAAQDLVLTPAARAAYKAAWAASEGQPVPARFAAAEAAAAATESADWPTTIRTEQDNARTMQRLASITGRASAEKSTECPECNGTGKQENKEYCPWCKGDGKHWRDKEGHRYGNDTNEDDDSGRDYEEELAGDYYSQAFD